MTDQHRINGHSHPTPPEEISICVALIQQFATIPLDGRARAGTFTRRTAGQTVQLASAPLPLPDSEVVLDQRLARFINTVTEPGEPTIRQQFLHEHPGTVVAWWTTIGFSDGARLTVATTPAGGWYDAAADHADADPTICQYADPSAVDWINPITGLLEELARPATLRPQTPTAWAALQTRMCGCWHPFAEHHLTGPNYACDHGCGCHRFCSTDDDQQGRWINDSPAVLAALNVGGSCPTATHHTGPDGRRWHWVPDFLTRHGR
ncbi:hypothetical protein [Actinocatenispora comari]|uniref:Uncharacterized protein n=1 Tax=Actinocatenispora comari TaxID=2807577 RepID=A0A8J4AGH1_9ACTN|nr:hypothetical protein [Actinocatenispora comari]GIL29120.1 hypothetical protein NUM_43740 [Actinocatenispora comari]